MLDKRLQRRARSKNPMMISTKNQHKEKKQTNNGHDLKTFL
ncbi:hypothetical protein CUZ90_1115 [Enterococcus faecium]|nr:hypothetical protein [Enterococcus faecium]MBK4863958.1 hypothetical protein [Enterococcus faecium]